MGIANVLADIDKMDELLNRDKAVVVLVNDFQDLFQLIVAERHLEVLESLLNGSGVEFVLPLAVGYLERPLAASDIRLLGQHSMWEQRIWSLFASAEDTVFS